MRGGVRPREVAARAGAGFVLTFLLYLGANALGLRSLGIIPPFETAPLLALAGALVALTPLRHALWALGGSVVLALLIIGFTPVVVGPARALVRSEAPEPLEAVVVLAAGVRKNGEIGPVMQARLVKGYELLRAGYARELVITDIPPPKPPASSAVRKQKERFGLSYPLNAVGPVRNTRDEAIRVARLAERRGWNRVLLVSSPFHLRRAEAVFEKAGAR